MTRKIARIVPLLALFSSLSPALNAAPAGRQQTPQTPQTKAYLAEYGTAAQQSRVRTNREAALLPLQAACNVDTSRELFITNLSVVEDCFRTTWSGTCTAPATPATRGAWTLGKLMEGIFGTTDPVTLSNKTKQFFNELSVDHTINGDFVALRPDADSLIVQTWAGRSGGGTQLDMKQAPFQLNAIVARLDMRQNGNGTQAPTGGELHFVYQLLVDTHFPPQVYLIVEYNLDAAGCADILAWANRFHALGGVAFGKNYSAKLQAITDLVNKINASPGKLNGSALNQVRTNELTLGPGPWQLRQFKLAASTSGPASLLETTVPQTPSRTLQGTAAISNYINANSASILAGTYTVPNSFGGSPFLGGFAPHTLDLKWDGPSPACSAIVNKDARAAFSANTCSGCHGGETTTGFIQVGRRITGFESGKSNFLKGATLTDICGVSRTYNEIERRRVDLCQLLSSTCTQINAEPDVTFAH
jgi:hypothetical protein